MHSKTPKPLRNMKNDVYNMQSFRCIEAPVFLADFSSELTIFGFRGNFGSKKDLEITSIIANNFNICLKEISTSNSKLKKQSYFSLLEHLILIKRHFDIVNTVKFLKPYEFLMLKFITSVDKQ